MNRLIKSCALLAAAAFLLCGCGSSQESQEATTEVKEKEITIDYGKGLNEEGKVDGITASDVVTVCDYIGIEVKKADVEPSDDDVSKQIDSLLEQYPQTEGSVEKGDTVSIDYTGTIDGKEFEGGSASGYELTIGSGTFIDGFEDQMIGHEVGDSFDVKVTFPKDYASEQVAGKDAVFSVTINSMEPKLTDEFVAANFSETNGISTVDELKKKVNENLIASNEINYLWDYLLTNSTFAEIPEEFMEDRLDVSYQTILKQYHDYMGYDVDQIATIYGYENEEELRESFRDDTEKSAKIYLISSAIADKEKLVVNDDAAGRYLGEDAVDSYYDTYGKSYVNAQIMISMVGDYLCEKATLK